MIEIFKKEEDSRKCSMHVRDPTVRNMFKGNNMVETS